VSVPPPLGPEAPATASGNPSVPEPLPEALPVGFVVPQPAEQYCFTTAQLGGGSVVLVWPAAGCQVKVALRGPPIVTLQVALVVLPPFSARTLAEVP
jgi:hypothetical protein